MEQAEANRRLCALVAVDMAGYSGRAETDEAAAVSLVSELSRLVHETTEVMGGRVFNTAGDGSMLEFPTVTNALTAAEAILAGAPAPVRIGLHLGEVAVAPSGDLLGHGVNVAARLQQAAEPGEIMVSDDVKRALRGPAAERLRPVGRLRLAKMKEDREVYSLRTAGAPGPKLAFKVSPRLCLVLAGVTVLAATLALSWRLAPSGPPADPLLAAVRSFQSEGAGLSPAYGATIADRLTSALADRQAPTVSRALVGQGKLGGARLILGGTVERDGPLLRVRVQMDDAKSGQALWSTSFERPATEDLALQSQTATNVAEVIVSLRDEMGPDARGVRPDVLAAYVQAVDLQRQNRGSFEKSRQAYQRLAALAPKSSRVHSSLAAAITLTVRLTRVAPDVAARWRAEAVAEAQRALKIDPRNAAGYLDLADLAPPSAYFEREALLAKAKKAEPDSANVMSAEGEHLRNVGRQQASLVLYQQALALDPYRPGRLASNIFALAGLDRWDESRAVGAQAAQLLPENGSVRRANLFTALLFAPPAQAAAAIDTFQAGQPRLEPVGEKAWRDFVAARAGKLSPELAAKALLAAPRAENGVNASTAMSAFAMLGKVDEAFAEAEQARAQGLELHVSNLYETPTKAMRLDPRFMPLASRLGLVSYWRRSGHWPDFCQGPARLYDCKAKADAMVPAAPG